MTLLTHKRMLDAAVTIQSKHKHSNGDELWFVCWFNRRGLFLGSSDEILIKKKELKNWYVWKT